MVLNHLEYHIWPAIYGQVATPPPLAQSPFSFRLILEVKESGKWTNDANYQKKHIL